MQGREKEIRKYMRIYTRSNFNTYMKFRWTWRKVKTWVPKDGVEGQ